MVEKVKITKAQIAELQATIEDLKREKADVDSRLDNANAALYQVEREFKRNQKPTPAMLDMLRLLSKGAYIAGDRWDPAKLRLRSTDSAANVVRDSVFYGLLERDAIARSETGSREWRITEHGTAIITAARALRLPPEKEWSRWARN